MVATLLSLRFRVLANTLRRSTVQLVAVVLGALQALVLLVLVLLGVAFLGGDALPTARDAVVVFGGVVVTIGWILVPLVATGVEPTLEPRRLAPFPIPVPRIMTATVLVELLWPPGVATLVGALASVAMWRTEPAAAAVQVAGALVATATCLVGSRAAASVAAILVARRLAGRALLIVGGTAVLLGPVALCLALALPAAEPVPALTEALGWTPFGAAWSVPVLVASGRPLQALASAGIALATLGALLLLWRASLVHALRSRPVTGRPRREHELGLFRIVPATPAGAIAARSAISWLRDARLARQLVVLPLLPVLVLVLAAVVRLDGLALAAAPVVAGLVPLAQFAGLSYDGTAFAGQLAAGVRGTADRLGRSAALLVIALPAVLVVAVVSVLLVGDPAALPAVAGLTVGALLTGLAVTAVSSALVVVPIPASRRNPFTAAPGSNTTQVLGSYVVTGIAAALMLPELALGVGALVSGSVALGWAALAVGALWGAGKLALGIRIGGRLLDRTGPELLLRLRRVQLR